MGTTDRVRIAGRAARLLLATFATGCSAAPSFLQVSNTPAAAYEASLAPVRDGFIAAWYDTRDGHGEIYARRLDAEGRPIAPERRLTAGQADAFEADAAPLRDGFVLGWYEKAQDGHLIPKIGAWALDGTSQWVTTLSPRGRNTVVRAAGGLVFAAWIEDETDDRAGVWVTWRRSDNVTLIPPRRVADAGKTTFNLNAAIDPAASPGKPRAWLVFDAKAGTRSEELFLVSTTETIDHVYRLTPDDGSASKYPDIALTDARAAVAWFDTRDGNEEVYLAVAPLAAFTDGTPPSPHRITETPGHSIGAYVAWNGDRLGLAWCDDTTGNQELFFQSFDRDGGATDLPVRVTTTPATSSIPAIKPLRQGFALLWNEYEAPGGEGHSDGGRSQIAFAARR